MTPYWTVLLAVLLAGLLVHETTHYLACRLLDAPARPSYRWGAMFPNPVIRTELRAHTPTTYRMVTLAPLVVFAPSVVGVLWFFPLSGDLAGLAVMWCLTTMPSPADFKQAYAADGLATWHDVWQGKHSNHAAAEGVW